MPLNERFLSNRRAGKNRRYVHRSISLPIRIPVSDLRRFVANRLLVSLEIKVDEKSEVTCKETTSK